MNLPRLINNQLRPKSLSLKNRLWLLQGGLVALLTVCAVLMIFTSDIPKILNSGPYKDIQQELNHKSSILQKKYSLMFVNTVDLAKKVNTTFKAKMNEKGLTTKDLKSHPEIIEGILENGIGISTNTMEKTGCSGVFLILDATINPSLPDAKNSKAGIYIRDINSHFFPFQSNKYYLYRGSSKIARKFDMYLDSQWQLEYNISSTINTNSNVYTQPFNAALTDRKTDLQNLGYWSSTDYPQSAKVVTLSVPLIDNDGIVYGVCGLEISEYFLQTYFNNSDQLYPSLSFIFAKENNGNINIPKSLLLDGYPIAILCKNGNYLKTKMSERNDQFQYFIADNDPKNKIIGVIKQINIYPEGSVFKNDNWCLFAFLQPKDINSSINLMMAVNIFALLIIGVIIAYFISRYYSGRITNTIKQLKEQPEQIGITNIPEIDDLVEFLKNEYLPESEPETNAQAENIQEHYAEFLAKLNSLSRTEREIFDLYLQGLNAKQICEVRYISINTLKTHNRNIYKKLDVNSRAELLENFNKMVAVHTPDS